MCCRCPLAPGRPSPSSARPPTCCRPRPAPNAPAASGSAPRSARWTCSARRPAARITYAPGIDRIGTTVPAAAFHTSAGGPAGLTRTTTAPDGTVTGTQVDATLAGDQTDLVKGNTYTWTGYVTVPAADTWTLWLQRPAGTVVGSPSGPNGGVNPGYQAGPFTGVFDSASLTVDGTAATLRPVSTLHPNDYKGGPTLNGQYLGLTTVGAALPLTPGQHQISITYATPPRRPPHPTLRLAWAPQQHDLDAAVAAAAQARHRRRLRRRRRHDHGAGDVGTLGPGQDDLIQKVAAANPNTVVVLNTGAGVQMPWLRSVKGVLEMWFPGQEGGTATANLLLGKANPSGQAADHLPGRQRLHAIRRAPGARDRRRRPDRLVRGPADGIPLVSGQQCQAAVPVRVRLVLHLVRLQRPEGQRAARTLRSGRPCPSGSATPAMSPGPRFHSSTCRCPPRRLNLSRGWSASTGSP